MITRKTGRRLAGLLAAALGLTLLVGQARAAGPVASVAALAQRGQAELAAHPGRAVLDFQRALLLAPRAPELRDGLARAEAAAGLAGGNPSRLARVAARLSPDEWSRLALAALALAAVATTAAAWRLRRRWTVSAAVAALLLAVTAGGVAWRTAPRSSDAVVVGANTLARIAPFAGADEAFVAPEGARVTIQAIHQGFARIRGERGAGWVPSSAVEPIIPGS